MSGISLATKGMICPTQNIIRLVHPYKLDLKNKLIEITLNRISRSINLEIDTKKIRLKKTKIRLNNIKTSNKKVSWSINNDC